MSSQTATRTTSLRNSPFKFLDYYVEEDQCRFAGRDREIRDIVAGIANNRTFIIYGRSGLGKTSMLLAGVFPVLRKRGYQPVYIRTLESPLADLCRTISKELGNKAVDNLKRVRQLLKDSSEQSRPIVLLLDQFEEFFVRFRENEDQRQSFIKGIAELAGDPSLHLHVVFSLREDYLAELNDFRRHLQGLFKSQYRLLPLTAFGARQAIERPLIEAGIRYDHQLLIRLVDRLDEVGYDPALLQITCTELYLQAAKGRESNVELREADLAELDELEGIFKRYLDEITRRLEKGKLFLLRTLLDALITPERTKSATTIEKLCQKDFNANAAEVSKVMNLLVEQRIVRGEHRGHEYWYELIHERLVEIILRWLELDDFYFKYRHAKQLVKNSARGGKNLWSDQPETLMGEGQLRELVQPYQDRFRFNQQELAFVFWSSIYRHQKADMVFWADAYRKQFGQAQTVGLIDELSRNPSPQMREGAAMAAGLTGEPGGALADRCLEMALSAEESEQVRRAAGTALARLAGRQQRETLLDASKAKHTRRAAREIQADFYMQNAKLQGASRRDHRRAKRIAQNRILKEKEPQIHERGRYGATYGLLGTLAWGGTVGVFLLLAFHWVAGIHQIEEFKVFWAFLLLPLMGCGALLGWRLSISDAKESALRGEGRWFVSLSKCKTCYLIIFLFTFIPGIVLANLLIKTLAGLPYPYVDLPKKATVFGAAGLLLAGMLTWAIWFAIRWIASASRYLIWPFKNITLALGSVLLTGFWIPSAFALLVCTLVFVLLDQPEKWVTQLLVSLTVVAMLIGSFLTFTLLALARNSMNRPLGKSCPINNTSRAWGSCINIVCALAVPAYLLAICGWDTIPPLAPNYQLVLNKELTISNRLGPSVLDADYFRLENSTARSLVVQVMETPTNAVSRLAKTPIFISNDSSNSVNALLIPPGSHLASVVLSGTDTNSLLRSVGKQNYQFRFNPMAAVTPPDQAGGIPEIGREKATYVEVPCHLSPQPGGRSCWKGSLGGSISGPPPASNALIEISLCQPCWISPEGSPQWFSESINLEKEIVPTALKDGGDTNSGATNGSDMIMDVQSLEFRPEGYAVIEAGGGQLRWNAQLRFWLKTAENPNTAQSRSWTEERAEARSNATIFASVRIISVKTPTLYEKAATCASKGLLDEAIGLNSFILKLEPNAAGYKSFQGWLLFMKGRYKEGLGYAKEAVNRDSENADFRHTLGHLHLKMNEGGREQAFLAWKKANELQPDFFTEKAPEDIYYEYCKGDKDEFAKLAAEFAKPKDESSKD